MMLSIIARSLLLRLFTVLVLALSSVLYAAERNPEPGYSEPPSLLPDVEGRLRQVVISANSARRSSLRNSQLVSNIVNSLPASTKVYILVNDRDAFTVLNNPWRDRVRFIEVPASNSITIWTQDPFLVLQSPAAEQPTTLLTSKAFERADDAVMAARISNVAGYRVKPSGLYFEGGNIVSDKHNVFVGANTIRYNALELKINEKEVVLRFEQELGRPVMVVGPFPQPVAHIDMMMTPLGHRRVALADANAGVRIAEQALENDPESVAAFEQHCEDYFFGHRSIKVLHDSKGQAISAPQVRGKTREMIELSKQIAPVLDGIASSLRSYGYRVVRIPFLFGGPESANEAGETTVMRAAYPMLTYNNVLLEVNAGRRKVYLPRYGWPAMDRAAEAAWQRLGYAPHTVDDMAISAMYGGALRCSVKVLEKDLPEE